MKQFTIKILVFFILSQIAIFSVNSQETKSFIETFPGKDYKIKLIFQDELSINYCFKDGNDYRGLIGLVVELDKCLNPKSYEKSYLLVIDKKTKERVYSEFSGSIQVEKVLPDSVFSDRLLKLTEQMQYEFIGSKEHYKSERISFFLYFDIICQ